MALVGYDSSDDDEEVEVETLPSTEPPKTTEPTSVKTNGEPGEHHATRDKGFILCNAEPTIQPQTVSDPAAPAPAPAPSEPEQPSLIGPMRPPEGSSSLDFPPLEEAPAGDEVPSLSLPPGSPYSANRALLRDLTLPTVPDMDIPPSPPGSPPLAANKKFEQFLELKKKGVHFNSKIAQSSALKNPSLMDKLLKFAEIDQKGQYATTLGTDLWDPSAFPKSAHKEQLRQSQTDLGQARARTKGGPVDFVTAGGLGSRDATPSIGQAPTASTGKRKTRFDT